MQRVLVSGLLRNFGVKDDQFLFDDNGKKAIEIWSENKADIGVVVTDYEMPIRNGLDVLDAISKVANVLPLMYFHNTHRTEYKIKKAAEAYGAKIVANGEINEFTSEIAQGLLITQESPNIDSSLHYE